MRDTIDKMEEEKRHLVYEKYHYAWQAVQEEETMASIREKYKEAEGAARAVWIREVCDCAAHSGCGELCTTSEGALRVVKGCGAWRRGFRGVDGCSMLTMIVEGCRGLWRGVCGCRWWERVVEGCRWLWMVLDGCTGL